MRSGRRSLRRLGLLAGFFLCVPGATAQAAGMQFGYGRVPSAREIGGWDIDVRGQDGLGLPPGRGSVKQGEALFDQQCTGCHGDFGEGRDRIPALFGGNGTLSGTAPVRTVGSYWPYAPTLFDYVRRTMPYEAPQSLSNDQVYAVVAYVLSLSNLLPGDAALDAARLKAVRMPNREGFAPGDPRPDVRNAACMQHCLEGPARITSIAPQPQ